jgi:hypothetical protein
VRIEPDPTTAFVAKRSRDTAAAVHSCVAVALARPGLAGRSRSRNAIVTQPSPSAARGYRVPWGCWFPGRIQRRQSGVDVDAASPTQSPERLPGPAPYLKCPSLDRECSFSSPERVLAIGAIGGVHDEHRQYPLRHRGFRRTSDGLRAVSRPAPKGVPEVKSRSAERGRGPEAGSALQWA